MNYWPGTKIIKSQGNAFDWRNTGSHITQSTEWKQSAASKTAMAGKGTDPKRQFTIYSRARQSQ